MDIKENSQKTSKSANRQKSLVLAALAVDQPGIASQFATIATASDCNILDSHMTVFGHEFGVLMQIEGQNHALSSFKETISALQKSNPDIEVIVRETGMKSDQLKMAPYKVSIISLDHPGLVKEVTRYLSERAINIENLSTQAYAAPHTGSTMFSMTLIISIPSETSIKAFKTAFVAFCDDRNLDAQISAIDP